MGTRTEFMGTEGAFGLLHFTHVDDEGNSTPVRANYRDLQRVLDDLGAGREVGGIAHDCARAIEHVDCWGVLAPFDALPSMVGRAYEED